MKKIEKMKIEIYNQKIDLLIIRKKIKNTYIRIDENLNILVTSNYRTSNKEIHELIIKYQDKIINNINSKRRKILPNDKIYYLGNVYNLEFSLRNTFGYKVNDNKIIIYTNKTKNEYKEEIDKFYRSEAKIIFNKRLEICFKTFTKIHKINYPILNIRKMKKRYGTCYYNKNKICLNMFLIKYDFETIDYVIYHELSHFIYNDHGYKFYGLLSTIVENHKDIKQKLNK